MGDQLDTLGRSFASKLLIIVTDGKYTTADPKDAAQDLQVNGVEIIVVGVTDNIDEQNLQDMSSSPGQLNRNYFLSPDYADLENKAALIGQYACPGEYGLC